jgi:hypothetical protein
LLKGCIVALDWSAKQMASGVELVKELKAGK